MKSELNILLIINRCISIETKIDIRYKMYPSSYPYYFRKYVYIEINRINLDKIIETIRVG